MWKVAFSVATILALLPTLAISAPTTAIVAGAGVGGLYTAAKLAQSGVAVTLVEQNSRDAAGGRLACETVVADGRKFRFETGPSLLLLPSIYREALSSLGLDPSKHLNLKRCMPSYGVHFRDGLPSPLEIGGNAASERALEQAMESVEPGSYTAYCDYLVSARANLKAGLPIFIREQLGLDELATLPGFLRAALLGGGADPKLECWGVLPLNEARARRRRECARLLNEAMGNASPSKTRMFKMKPSSRLSSTTRASSTTPPMARLSTTMSVEKV